MSVTKYIKANTATQVNSSLIGVGVHPSVGTINMNYPWFSCTTRSAGTGYRAIISVLFTGDTVPYAYTAVTETGKPDGVTPEVSGPTYYNFKFYNSPARNRKSSIWLTVPRDFMLIADTNVYEVVEEVVEGETVYTVTVIGTVQGYAIGGDTDTQSQKAANFLEVSVGNLKRLAEDGEDGYRFDPNNWYVYDDFDNLYGVSLYGLNRYTTGTITLSAERQSVSSWEGKYEWVGTPMIGGHPADSNYQNISVWTDVEEPAVSDPVYYAKNDTSFNVMNVTSTEPGAISCSVSYSVDGITFTQVEDTLTDANNVIANVPRYVYLKFSQDVEITEE